MEITTTTINRNPGRRAAVNALAIVGFIALIIIGIGLAVYSARYMPKLTSRLGGASVFLSSIFKDGNEDEPSLDVVTATSSLSIIDEEVTPAATTTEPTVPVKTTSSTGTGKTVTTVRTVVTTNAIDPNGKPDLGVRITDVGYVRRDGDTDTFVSSNSVPKGKDGAVKFTVVNNGTNVTGTWKFEVDVPTSPAQHFISPAQKSLKPGDSVDYVLGFEKGKKGDDRNITVTVDYNDKVTESNEHNNEATKAIDIKG